MSILTRGEILQADDLKTEIVQVPEWGGEVIVRTLTGIEYGRFEQDIISSDDDQKDLTNIRARLCSFTIVDEEGNLLFEKKEIIELGKKSVSALNRVFNIAQKLNGMAPGDIEEMAKNSKETPDESSG